MKLYFRKQLFSYQLLRTVSYSSYQGAEIGECLATAARIKEDDFDSWRQEWLITSKNVEQIGYQCIKQSHKVSGCEALLRASNYYRTAEFFIPATDPEKYKIYRKSSNCFKKAMTLMDFHCKSVNIPYEEIQLPGYFFTPTNKAGTKKPTLIFIGGFDSTSEELYFAGAAAAVKRGYNCLVFDGPGQGAVLMEQKVPCRYDFEAPVSWAIDYICKIPTVDKNKICLMGMSLGGYLAPRAAIHEKRIKACIAFDLFFDVWDATVAQNSRIRFLEGPLPDSIKKALIKRTVKKDKHTCWLIKTAQAFFGSEDINELQTIVKRYNIVESISEITCPLFVAAGEKDHFVPLRQLANANLSSSNKTVRIFTAKEGAEEHCQMGNISLFHQAAFDWLDESL